MIQLGLFSAPQVRPAAPMLMPRLEKISVALQDYPVLQCKDSPPKHANRVSPPPSPDHMQMLFPMAQLFQVFRYMPRKQDVLGIATIHHPLRNVDAGAGYVRRPLTSTPAHRAAVHAHAQLELRCSLAARLISGRIPPARGVGKNCSHPIASRDRNQPMARFRFAELFRATEQSPFNSSSSRRC
jgi:hypothetical protein